MPEKGASGFSSEQLRDLASGLRSISNALNNIAAVLMGSEDKDACGECGAPRLQMHTGSSTLHLASCRWSERLKPPGA